MKIAVFTCDFHNEPKVSHFECLPIEGVGDCRVTYVTESDSTHTCYSSKRGDISWDKESVTITLLYEKPCETGICFTSGCLRGYEE